MGWDRAEERVFLAHNLREPRGMEAAFMDVVTLSGRHDTTETLSRLLAEVLSLKQIEAQRSDVAVRFAKANWQVDDRAGVASRAKIVGPLRSGGMWARCDRVGGNAGRNVKVLQEVETSSLNCILRLVGSKIQDLSDSI